VKAVRLDDLLLEASAGGRRRIQLLRVSGAGSVRQILQSARRLALVDVICGDEPAVPGEGPEMSHPDRENFKDSLRAAGFRTWFGGEDTGAIGVTAGCFFANREDG
jgi:hypothetical protein